MPHMLHIHNKPLHTTSLHGHDKLPCSTSHRMNIARWTWNTRIDEPSSVSVHCCIHTPPHWAIRLITPHISERKTNRSDIRACPNSLLSLMNFTQYVPNHQAAFNCLNSLYQVRPCGFSLPSRCHLARSNLLEHREIIQTL